MKEKDRLDVVKLDKLTNCARCGLEHENIVFNRLTYSLNLYDPDGDGPYNYWATCPTNSEPILLWSSDTNTEKDK